MGISEQLNREECVLGERGADEGRKKEGEEGETWYKPHSPEDQEILKLR